MSDLTAKKNRSAFSGILHPFRPVRRAGVHLLPAPRPGL